MAGGLVQRSVMAILYISEGLRDSSCCYAWVRLKENNVAILLVHVVCVLVLRLVGMGDKSGAMLGALCWIFFWWMTEWCPSQSGPISADGNTKGIFRGGIVHEQCDSAGDQELHSGDCIGVWYTQAAGTAYMMVSFSREKVSPPLLLLGFCGAMAFVSIQMHNVAAAVMMMPVGYRRSGPPNGHPRFIFFFCDSYFQKRR